MDFLSTLTKSDVQQASYCVYAWPNARATDFLGGDQWQVVKRLRFTIDNEGLQVVEVPSGFIVNRKALPWSLRWFAPIWGKHSAASVLYQFLIEGKMTTINTIPKRLTRREIHYAAMGLIGADPTFGFWQKLLTTVNFTWLGWQGKHYDVEVNPNKLFFEIEYEQRDRLKQAVQP